MSTVTKMIRTLVPMIRSQQFGSNPWDHTYLYPVYSGSSVRDVQGCKLWKTKIREGSSATTVYAATRNQIELIEPIKAELWTRQASNPNPLAVEYRFKCDGSYPVEPTELLSHISSVVTTADNMALIRVRAAVKAQQQHMSGFTFLGELRETIQGLRHPLDAFAKGLNEYTTLLNKRKRGVREKTPARRRRALLDIASGTWLEASFGLMPLLSDAKDIAETLARYQYDSRHSVVRGYGEQETATFSEADVNIIGSLGAHRKVSTRTKAIVVYRCGVKAADDLPPFGTYSRLAELAGFNLQDFVPSVYNVIPYSWLLDYFSNVGSVVEANLTSTANVSWINRSIIVQTNRVSRYVAQKDPTSVTQSLTKLSIGSDGLVHKSLKSFNRDAPTTIPFASFESFLPGKASQYVNMLAVLAQRTNKFFVL